MPNISFSCLVLPRLHPELTDDVPHPLPAGSLFLWPGLPHPPESGVCIPDYPWSPAQAAACVADFEQAGRDGSLGAPVGAFSVATMLEAGKDLSPAERRALRELMDGSAGAERAASSPAAPAGPDADGKARRQAAQRVLLLAWLQEKQALELRQLARRVRREQSALAGLLGEGNTKAMETGDGGPDDAPLPSWRSVLAAASVFLPVSAAPGRPGGQGETPVLAVDRDMAAALAALATASPAARPSVGEAEAVDVGENKDLPPGFAAVRASLGRVLGRGWSAADPERVLLFFYPSAWA